MNQCKCSGEEEFKILGKIHRIFHSSIELQSNIHCVWYWTNNAFVDRMSPHECSRAVVRGHWYRPMLISPLRMCALACTFLKLSSLRWRNVWKSNVFVKSVAVTVCVCVWLETVLLRTLYAIRIRQFTITKTLCRMCMWHEKLCDPVWVHEWRHVIQPMLLVFHSNTTHNTLQTTRTHMFTFHSQNNGGDDDDHDNNKDGDDGDVHRRGYRISQMA